MSWLRSDDKTSVLSLHIQPGAKKTEVVGLYGTALKIRLAAPPVDGKANAALLVFLAETMGTAKSALELISGESSRAKRVRVSGITEVQIRQRLQPPHP